MVFGVPIIYFFFSREKILASERQIQEEKIRRLTMEKEAAMTGLQLLQAQIEPHFLFNTLSNIASLMDADAARARKMLTHLNEYLRISLERTRKQMVTLDRELDLVRHYLDIFKIRMGRRLDYNIRFEGGKAAPGFVAFPPPDPPAPGGEFGEIRLGTQGGRGGVSTSASGRWLPGLRPSGRN